MKISPKDRHDTVVTRRGLFSPSSGHVVSEIAKPRTEMTASERVTADRRAVKRSMAAARTACVLADQRSQQFIQNPQPKNPHDRRLSRRTFVAAAGATVLATKAFADTPFTSFAFPGAGRPANRTMPARIADIFNVLDFGADPTGVADSQPAYQAAVTAASNNGIIFSPKGNYKVLSGILVPIGSSLQFIGEGIGSGIQGNFNGFIIDNLSTPYNAAGAPCSVENMNIANTFVGNTFSVAANGTWSASGSPVSITLSGTNPGIAAGGALWVSGSGGLSTNSVFIGMITSVASWPTVTVSSAAVGSGGVSNCAVHVIQCYAAGGTWNGPGNGTINSYTYNSGTGLVTLTLAAPTTLSANNRINASGLNIAGLNGDFNVAAPVTASTTVTYTAPTGQGGSPSGGGAINWGGAAQITMAASRPAGIGTGLWYVYDYEDYLADPRTDFPIGVASWDSGTTVTFVPQLSFARSGAIAPSIGSSDRLWFAPVAGAIRYSSVVGAKITRCFLSGFWGITSVEDKVVANDPTAGAAEAYHIVIDTCTFSNPAGFSGLMGQTGVYLTNNSIAINSNSSGLWCAERLSGTACGIIGGRAEVNHFATIIGGDTTTSNGSLSDGFIIGRSMESNLQAIYCKGGSASITSCGASCNALSSTVLGGLYLNAFAGVIENSGFPGNYGNGYAIYIADAGNQRGSITLISVSGINFSTPSQSWRVPAQAWWGTAIQCLDWNGVSQVALKLAYTYAMLPGVSTNPAAVEGDEFNISDGTNGLTWGNTATNTGTHTTHYKVRYNGTNWTVVGA